MYRKKLHRNCDITIKNASCDYVQKYSPCSDKFMPAAGGSSGGKLDASEGNAEQEGKSGPS